jgi:lysophospholipase L1-like esterase
MRKRTTTGFLALALAAGAALPARAQVRFNDYVSIGDSFAAGFSSGSLVETHQRNSVPALLARQAAVPLFQMPLVSEPGIPAELVLVSLSPGPIILPKSTTTGQPVNLQVPRPYNNLAVPGARAKDALTRSTDGGGFHDLILRKFGPQVAQAKLLRPSFVTLWIGNNDVLSAVLAGRVIEATTLTPAAEFRLTYAAIVSELKSTGASIVAANLPDVTTIPFVTTIPPVVVNPATRQPVIVSGQTIPLLGPDGPLPGNSLVTLGAASLLAQGIGIPKPLGGQGTPLPDNVILDAGEVAAIQDRVAADNQSIADVCASAGIPVLDIHGILADLVVNGREVGGIRLSADFLTGGVFSYDGVHPTDLGYAVVANEWISVINAHGGSLPPVDLAPFLGIAQSASHREALPELSQEAFENLLAALRVLE